MTKICLYCGNEFLPSKATQKFCRTNCTKYYSRKKLRGSLARECSICGVEYLPNSNAQKTCSQPCREEKARRYSKAYNRDPSKQEIIRASRRRQYWKNPEKYRELGRKHWRDIKESPERLAQEQESRRTRRDRQQKRLQEAAEEAFNDYNELVER